MKVTIRAANIAPRFTGGTGEVYRARRAWSVWVDGEPRRDLAVVLGWALTVVKADGPGGDLRYTGTVPARMVTSWHGGIGPGDLARLVVPRLIEKEVAS